MRPPGAWAPLLVVVSALSGCAGSAAGPAPPTPLRVEYAGCETVLAGPVCAVPESRRLRVWVETATDATIEIEAGGDLPAVPSREVQQGRLFELVVGPQATALTVRARRRGAAVVWSLALQERVEPEWLGRVRGLLRERQVQAARRLLEEHLATASEEGRGTALGRLARIELQAGEVTRAADLLARAVQAHRRSGRFSDQVDDATVMVYLLLTKSRDFTRARAILDSLPAGPDAPAEVAYYLAYYRGLLAVNTGDLRSALRSLSAAARRAERAGMVREQRIAEEALVVQLQRAGAHAEAAALSRRLWRRSPEGTPPCERAQGLNNLAWSLLLAREAEEPVADPTPLLEEALAIFEQQCPHLAHERVNVRLNLTLSHLLAGRVGAARRHLEQARSLGPAAEPRFAFWRLDLEGRIALHDRRPAEALRLYDELAALAAASFAPEARWRAAFGRAQSLESLGQRAGSLEAFAEAESLLDEESLLVPLDEGRGGFVARHQEATRLYLDLLLASGLDSEALAVVRRSRSRVLAGLQRDDRLAHLPPREQELWDRAMRAYRQGRQALDAESAGDWGLPVDRLADLQARREERWERLHRSLDDAFALLGGTRPPVRPPPPGELLLAYHPLPEGWVGLAQDQGGVVARRLGCVAEGLAAPRMAACLLEPFAGEIARARRVRVLPYGFLQEVDFHALPFAGQVLLAHKPVVYGLDLAAPPRRVPPVRRRALVVADPRGDLPAARREARAVEEALRGARGSWTVEILQGAEATGEAVRRRLGEVELFHFAGHAVFSGREGWESTLPLAAGGRLTVGDVLALERAPTWVVLSGCETGRSSGAPVETLGLAQAFLAAGSTRVLAAVRPVRDRTAAALVRGLYRQGSGTPVEDDILQRALLALRREDSQADWSSFRVLEL